MSAYYNEFNRYAAQWLRNLIAAGHIAPGVVDERSIEDVHPDDLRGFTQCHFFAWIGVWSLALRRAGWPDDRPIWTGSCPCQPFSKAGKGAGFSDERHLWPAFFHLIGQRRPPVVAGEQVASKDANPWLDLVQADLEGLGYGVGAVPFPAAGIGAPHIRDRLYWVANRNGMRRKAILGESGAGLDCGHDIERALSGLGSCVQNGRVGDPLSPRVCREPRGVNSTQTGAGHREHLHDPGATGDSMRPRPTNGLWRDADWLFCRDGKWRPVEPGTFPLAHGAASRVGRLRAYGNAINASAAEIFIRCVMEAL